MVVPSRLLPVLSAALLCAAVAGCVHETADDRARLADDRARADEARRNARDLARRILAEGDPAAAAALSAPAAATAATNRNENGFVFLPDGSERRPVPPAVWAIATLQGAGPVPDDWPLVRRWLGAADAESRIAAARFGEGLLSRVPVRRLSFDGTVERTAAEDRPPLPDRDAARAAVDAVLAADAPLPVPPAFAATNAEVRVEAWLLAIRSDPRDGTIPDALSFLADASAAAARGDDVPVFRVEEPAAPDAWRATLRGGLARVAGFCRTSAPHGADFALEGGGAVETEPAAAPTPSSGAAGPAAAGCAVGLLDVEQPTLDPAREGFELTRWPCGALIRCGGWNPAPISDRDAALGLRAIAVAAHPRPAAEGGGWTLDVEQRFEPVPGNVDPALATGRVVRASLGLPPGRGAAFGTLAAVGVENVPEEDRVPVLSSIPLLGRLFVTRNVVPWTNRLDTVLLLRVLAADGGPTAPRSR